MSRRGGGSTPPLWWPSVLVFSNESMITLLDQQHRTANLQGCSPSVHQRFSVLSRLRTTLEMASDVSGVVHFFIKANCATWNSRVLTVSGFLGQVCSFLRPSSFAHSEKYSRLIVSGGDVALKLLLLLLLLVLHHAAVSGAGKTARADGRCAPVVTCGNGESRDLMNSPLKFLEHARRREAATYRVWQQQFRPRIVTACPLTPRASKIEIRPCGVLSHPVAVVNHASLGRHSKPFTRRAASDVRVVKKKKKNY